VGRGTHRHRIGVAFHLVAAARNFLRAAQIVRRDSAGGPAQGLRGRGAEDYANDRIARKLYDSDSSFNHPLLTESNIIKPMFSP